ncbi:MAG: hypothetical protein LC541_01725 [Candidatus Thiodiazotropha sp.]|nr:hypothetical protein [Candidatus Thiodiazotropha sp.]MCM8920182.1 hypothetical protein [Candidatus Thiodiazotropha sp.]
MSVDNSSNGDNSFSTQALNQALFENVRNQKLGYNFSSPLGNNLLGAYSRDQVIEMLADQLAKAPPGSASITGKNGLFRINWFDGRFLTAQAFRQQDSYWDQRLRLLAQIFPPGISWGLGLRGLEATLKPYPQPGTDNDPITGGTSLDTQFTLQPGVAFDGIGRPIVVGQEFCFCFRDLIPRFQSEPRQVADSGQRFQSCLCLEPFNGGAGTPGSALPPGPYLLMIEPRESPEGDAKVYGEVCAGEGPARCESNGWRGGFGLSLVRFPADPPSELNIAHSWTLRGILSAYYYDVFEHSLIERWDPEFLRENAFCEAVGNSCQQAGAVPLAMAYIGFDSSIIFLDQWIPRRGLAATNAANWTRTHFGAPTQSAADARLHQFQCMLKQSLSKVPLETFGQQAAPAMNLYERGFRHIPPVGFLPFDPYTTLPDLFDPDTDTSSNLLEQIPGFANVHLVERQIDRYFCGTSVIPYYVVALHDDDVLEDINNVFDKDPVRVDRLFAIDDRVSSILSNLCEESDEAFSAITRLFTRFISVFRSTVMIMLRDTDLLVNRDVELVKVIIPLQGLRRRHPVVGVTAEDTKASLNDWYSRPPGQSDGAYSSLARDRLIQFIREYFGMDALPRHFAVYIKQRMVLLDVIYVLFELFNQFLAFIDSIDTASTTTTSASTQTFRDHYLAQSQTQQVAAQTALGTPVVREVIAYSAVTANPELASPEMWDGFFAQVDAEDARLAEQIDDPVLRRQRAIDVVADAQGMDVNGFDTIKVLIASQSPEAAEASLRSIQRAANMTPALNERGLPAGASLNQELVHEGSVRVYEQANSRELWQAVNSGLKRQPASNLVGTARADVTVGEVLKLPSDEAGKLLGGSEGVDKLRKAIAPKVNKIAKEIDTIAASPPSAEVTAGFKKNLADSGGDPVKALVKTQTQFKTDATATAKLKRIKPIADLLGKDGFQPVADVMFRTP